MRALSKGMANGPVPFTATLSGVALLRSESGIRSVPRRPLAPARGAIIPVGDVSPSDLSAWDLSTTGYIGNTGSGTLTIDGGSTLLSASGLIGNGSTASGVVSVEGAGSTWTVNGTLSTGLSGAGTLSITAGGNLISGYGCVGSSTGSTGMVTVAGNGSIWTCSGLDVGVMAAAGFRSSMADTSRLPARQPSLRHKGAWARSTSALVAGRLRPKCSAFRRAN